MRRRPAQHSRNRNVVSMEEWRKLTRKRELRQPRGPRQAKPWVIWILLALVAAGATFCQNHQPATGEPAAQNPHR